MWLLQVGNQREVERWIDVMVVHGGVVPVGTAGKATGGEPAAAGCLRCLQPLLCSTPFSSAFISALESLHTMLVA